MSSSSLNRGAITIPKTTKVERIAENVAAQRVRLGQEAMAALDALHCDLRVSWDPTGVL